MKFPEDGEVYDYMLDDGGMFNSEPSSLDDDDETEIKVRGRPINNCV